ncbi:trafficking protein particle complex subunit 2/Sedlin [Patellaria atrata CBS 101060]|uniref:Trafficking protein particle complex subunit 2/Sedlin n=1 Tax=Patellaria atrata CBS 101060 TaxID=1346257 RepID=A0A9P4VRX7_9PEZI|nr:trafficking protein particle complex subunit 2/Sedlin [Patellaria atrata CBS 101060]
MSYYFAIIGHHDNPLFEAEFGTSKSGGDGASRFPPQTRYMNQFIVHAALDIVCETQWVNSAMYLKAIDTHPPTSSHVSCFLTPNNIRFMLLVQPHLGNPRASSAVGGRSGYRGEVYNPTAPATEEAIRGFFNEVFGDWIKATMNPFYGRDDRITSPVFRGRVMTAAKKFL